MLRVGVAVQRSVYRGDRPPRRERRFAGHIAAPGFKLRRFIALPLPGSWQAGADRTLAGSLRPPAHAGSATSARARPPRPRRDVAIRYRWSARLRTGLGRDVCRPRCRKGYPRCTGSISRGQASSSVPRVDGRPPLLSSHARRLAKIHGRRLYRGSLGMPASAGHASLTATTEGRSCRVAARRGRVRSRSRHRRLAAAAGRPAPSSLRADHRPPPYGRRYGRVWPG